VGFSKRTDALALPGTTLIALDASGTVRRRSTLPYRDINAIVFSPGLPQVMYFGLKLSDMTAGARPE
jgi:hypothetical protein